jgi:hypothetical protein
MNFITKASSAAILSLCLMLSSCSAGAGNTPGITAAAQTAAPSTGSATAEPETEEYEFEFKPYAITAARRGLLSDDAYEAYCRTVDAFLAAATEVKMTAGEADAVVSALCECFPPLWLADSLVFEPDTPAAETTADTTAESETSAADGTGEPQTEIGGTLRIAYKHDRDEHLERINGFFRRTAFIMHECGVSDASEIAAVSLYRYVATNVTDVAGKRTSSYDAIMSGAVMSGSGGENEKIKYEGGGSQALCYIYLLLQAGTDCTAVRGSFYGSPRLWCAAEIDGEWFWFDPGAEMNDTSGHGLMHFGMTDADLEEAGHTPPRETGFGLDCGFYTGPDTEPAAAAEPFIPVCSDERYALFRGCDYFETDAENKRLIIYYSDLTEPALYGYK